MPVTDWVPADRPVLYSKSNRAAPPVPNAATREYPVGDVHDPPGLDVNQFPNATTPRSPAVFATVVVTGSDVTGPVPPPVPGTPSRAWEVPAGLENSAIAPRHATPPGAVNVAEEVAGA